MYLCGFDLPDKSLDSYPILSALFSHCTLNDLISFRQVSKSWKSIIDKLLSSREELILFVETRPHQWYWSYESKPINFSNVVNVKDDFYFDGEYLKSTFKNIKALLVVSSSSFLSNRDFNEFLNHFIDLEHLQINYNLVKSKKNVYHFVIILYKLKTFYSDGDVDLYRMNCQNLVKLTLNSLHSRSNSNVAVLPKLKVLVLLNLYSISYFEKDYSPNLKELHIFKDKKDTRYWRISRWYENEKFDEDPKLFIEPDFGPGGPELDDVLKRYCDNVLDLNFSICDNLSFNYTDQLGKVIKRNKRLVQENGWRFKSVNFKTKFVNNEKFLNLGSYFTCIQFISIDTDLTQEQLDLLPMFSPLVKKVTFLSNFKPSSKDDYIFLCKLAHLKVFYSNDSRCFEHLREIIKNCEYFVRGESSSFIVRSENFSIFLIKDNKTKQKQTFTTSEELLDHIIKNYPQMLKN